MKAQPFAKLADSGVLWLVNRVVFHPRGFAIRIHTDEAGDATGWSIDGAGREPWAFLSEVDDAKFQAVEALLAEVRSETPAQ